MTDDYDWQAAYDRYAEEAETRREAAWAEAQARYDADGERGIPTWIEER